MRLLVAEDNPINQQVAMLMLQKLGYQADAVSNGYEAVEATRRVTYDLVLMDCEMPELDGYKATLEIRRLEGDNRHIPVIAMTANTNTGDRAKCLAAGMDDYVPKPVKEQKLRETLEAWLFPPKEDDPKKRWHPI